MEKCYHFTQLAVELNEMEPGVAPSDSRHRPDQRLMEEGKWDEANNTKVALEEKQRAARRKREQEAAEAAANGRSQAGVGLHAAEYWDAEITLLVTLVNSIYSFVALYMSAHCMCLCCVGLDYNGYTPKWFKKEKDHQTGNLIHMYMGDYWESKEKQEWSRCPDIYLWWSLPGLGL